MGSSGMKRKGRSHLPKVGTRLANEQELRDRRAEALHPFAGDPRRRRGGTAYQITAIIVAVVVLIGVIALIAVT
jgi:hypothetical protein